MKNVLSICLALAFVLGCVSVAVAQEAIPQGLQYFVDPEEVTITGYHGTQEEVVIPSHINGKPVTFIQGSAFQGNNYVTSVTVPNTVNEIGFWAFKQCANLTHIDLPDTGLMIEHDVFTYTPLSAEDKWENNLLYIDNHCISAKDITAGDIVVKEGTKTIANGAFVNCTGVTSVAFPESLVRIGNNAFEGCSRLATITMPSTVEYIGSRAFMGTAYVNNKENWGEEEVLYIGNHLYGAATTLAGKYAIKEGTQSIAPSAFYGCVSVTDVVVPNGIFSIPTGAFSGCIALKEVVLSATTERIEETAFYGCTALERITIPAGVTYINPSAFLECQNLTIVGSAGSYAEAFAKKNTIPFAAELPAVSQYTLGDVNEDDKVDAKDALLALKAAVNKIQLVDDRFLAAEVTGDNLVNAKDALEMLKFSVNKIEKFPIERL